ncbi:bZIP transcription factor [Halopenitus sp. H-Gu1]|uniref:DUF7518 family protein n=1 Tax=Halopenitus sp. H-Gu1 TaxID=3242697 RepID=UPI00359CE1C4
MSNRVEELERQVGELQAAVNGLTEELVEMKERVRQLEDGDRPTADDSTVAETATGTDQPSAGPTPEGAVSERTTKSDDHVDVVEQAVADSAAGDATEDADAGSEPAGDASESEPQESADDGESEESDIIVA